MIISLRWATQKLNFYMKVHGKIGKITSTGGFSTVLFKGTMSFSSPSIGSSYGLSCHHTEPLPSMTPFPWMVIPTSFVNSNHCSSPLPQTLAFVGATMVPSSWQNINLINLQLNCGCALTSEGKKRINIYNICMYV